jgi:hypothetical protein
VLVAAVGAGGSKELNIEGYFSRCTLDIIGLAGFGYDFSTVAGDENELASAFETIFNSGQQPGVLDMLALVIPGFPQLVRPPVCVLIAC